MMKNMIKVFKFLEKNILQSWGGINTPNNQEMGISCTQAGLIPVHQCLGYSIKKSACRVLFDPFSTGHNLN